MNRCIFQLHTTYIRVKMHGCQSEAKIASIFWHSSSLLLRTALSASMYCCLVRREATSFSACVMEMFTCSRTSTSSFCSSVSCDTTKCNNFLLSFKQRATDYPHFPMVKVLLFVRVMEQFKSKCQKAAVFLHVSGFWDRNLRTYHSLNAKAAVLWSSQTDVRGTRDFSAAQVYVVSQHHAKMFRDVATISGAVLQ
jgi:hypothetical protein